MCITKPLLSPWILADSPFAWDEYAAIFPWFTKEASGKAIDVVVI
jgi:hypothetical protein